MGINSSNCNNVIKYLLQWLLKYGLESLGLKFSKFEVSQLSHRKTYRHINHKVSNTSEHVNVILTVGVIQGGLVELYIDHKGLRKFSQRLRQARDHCSQKLRELANGLPLLFSRGLYYFTLLYKFPSWRLAKCSWLCLRIESRHT